MGDRGNIQIKDRWSKHDGVYLYSHWGGSELPQTLARALDSPQGRGGWTDSSYLTRVIFCQMLADGRYGDKDVLAGETGYGIGDREMDPEHPTLVVDCSEQTVNGTPFEEFIAHPREGAW